MFECSLQDDALQKIKNKKIEKLIKEKKKNTSMVGLHV